MTFSVRAAVIGDLPGMMALERHAATAAHWSAAQYEDLFHNSGRVALVMQEAGLQGFVIARVVDKEWEIENMVIAAPTRRRGLGTRLLGELLDLARAQNAATLFLEVRESNQAARALYEKSAFVESGRRRGYYRDPQEDAILYRLAFA